MERVEDFLKERVRLAPETTALSDSSGAHWSYAQLDKASDDLAAELKAVGVQPNDRVLLLVENCAAAVATLHAAWKIGAVIIPLNARQTEGEVARVVKHATPAAIVMTSHVSPDATAHATRMGAQEITGAFGTMHLAKGVSDPDPVLSDVAVLLYTTGTTGDPKGVMLTHSGVRFGGMASSGLRKMVPEDVVYGVLPMSHVFGLISVLVGACHTGAHVQIDARFSAQKLYDAAMGGVTIIPAVPQMHALVMQYTKEQGMERLGAPKLRYVSSGGAPLDPTWKRKAEAFYELPLQNGFGMTETSSGASATQNELGSPDISVGPVTPGTRARIDVDAPGGNGEEEGEVLVAGPHVMKGYYRNPTETAKAIDADGWLHTGDLGKIDEEGNLYILGRSKELIIHGGFNVYPPEVEAALNDHPQVIQSAVVGRTKDGDEEVLAFVQVADADRPDVEALRAFVKERLTGYKRPKHIVLATALPAAPTGKLLKHKMIETFADQLP
ncbi:class I adenylate-forming enzyme family protein [Sulfitobacter donghicola]|uniref:Long-chain fatty acid--CoA ligase n=1 Tax=Sulfitobacter donghicola DSW-25 = KCTC 12864 = JCM 14565 TaxID=1300350 RepID=A0A073IJK3_9RHOB|nr:class I adenylate-forming enzyme family protein [Sulfitobacter donghicola]KEJ89706.1 long-chain fatty acid--CoA ligase [Sulfitobacter donghicola DSW-25 = KCTC 12864 = JCM 14565]KIN67201.1 Long-chain-fatty-acid-CoA ligase [Sulfitobacter donghicola DSW-25 = KCTC 12864 = JCM 14565]